MSPEISQILGAAALRTVSPLLAPGAPPRAVAFDADGTLWRGDVGEDFLRYLAAGGLLPGRAAAGGLYEEYERRVEADPAQGYAFAVEVMADLEEQALTTLCQDFFARRFQGRLFAFTRPLLSALERAGHQLWVVSASPFWMVAVGAAALGIGADRVIAVRSEVSGGRLTAQVERPVPYGAGKVAHLERRGVALGLAVGNGEGDLPMLEYASAALVVAPHGDPGNGLVRAAVSRGWAIQRG
ncbi:MAG: HAD family hydrolase [Myxococcaceae bacterium]